MVFNPLDKRNLAHSVGNALLQMAPIPLREVEKFEGAGVYAIYYTGEFPAYRSITERNIDAKWEAPIYIGKAVPSGARKGLVDDGILKTNALFSRLQKHRKSIEPVQNLQLSDFQCRFLIVDDIWIPLGESLMINKYAPLWNVFLDGFGNNDPGGRRYDQFRSKWDVLHPGREWALRCAERGETDAEIAREVIDFLRYR